MWEADLLGHNGNTNFNRAYLGSELVWEKQDPFPPNNEIWYTSTNGNIVIPHSTDRLPTIISNTYADGKGIIKFNGPVTELGRSIDGTFLECTTLLSIILPNSVISVGTLAFRSCTNLVDVYIPDSVTEYKFRMLSGCAKLPSFNIPNTVTTIGTWVMSDCPKLEYIIIPDSVTYIDLYAFYNTGIKSATISKNITVIPQSLFSSCTKLTNIVYNGTTTQWRSLSKGSYWHSGVPATVVHCTDGDVAI